MFTKFLLFPPRFLFTLKARAPASNGEAVADYVAQFRDESVELAQSALRWRTSRADAAEVAAIDRKAVARLYLNFIDRYESELRQLGAPELADRFLNYRRVCTSAGGLS
jgi:hypothetical protein